MPHLRACIVHDAEFHSIRSTTDEHTEYQFETIELGVSQLKCSLGISGLNGALDDDFIQVF